MHWVILALVVGGGALAYRAWRRHTRPQRLFDTLCEMTRDPAVATRLVEGEMQRHPNLDEASCVARAIRQLKHDRR